MAVAQGYGKTVTSGSVFAYDTGDTVNSYRGEPTVNGVGNLNSYNPLDLYTWAPNGNTSTWARDTSAPLSPVKGIPLKEISSGTDSYSDTYNGSTDNIIAASSGQTWTVSVYALAAAGTNIQVWIFEANSSGNYIEADYNGFTATGVWQRISVTRTFSNGSTAYIQARVATATNGGVIWWDGLQVEQKSYPTPFINGTRSATQGLLPLVGNSTLDLTNVSFDSNAQMVFDGTDDYIDLGQAFFSGTNSFTLETVYTLDTTNTHTIVGNFPASSFQFMGGYGLYINGSCYFPSSLGPGTYHAVATRESGACKLYLNGTLVATATNNNSIGTNSFIVGKNTSGGEQLTGKIPVLKFYNRALTAAEVKQNYLHYKTRFNLS